MWFVNKGIDKEGIKVKGNRMGNNTGKTGGDATAKSSNNSDKMKDIPVPDEMCSHRGERSPEEEAEDGRSKCR